MAYQHSLGYFNAKSICMGMSTSLSLSVDEILLPRWVNWSTNFQKLAIQSGEAPSCLKQTNSVLYSHTEEMWYNETVCLGWQYIYICIYINEKYTRSVLFSTFAIHQRSCQDWQKFHLKECCFFVSVCACVSGGGCFYIFIIRFSQSKLYIFTIEENVRC